MLDSLSVIHAVPVSVGQVLRVPSVSRVWVSVRRSLCLSAILVVDFVILAHVSSSIGSHSCPHDEQIHDEEVLEADESCSKED